MLSEKLDESNFLLYAAKHYDNPQCTDTEEFYDDLKRFKYIKRLLGKYEETGELRERLIVNHLIILFNLFGPHAVRMLFLKVEPNHYHYLKPFLVLLKFMPDKVVIGANNQIIYSSDIPMDQNIVNVLRKI